MRKPYSFSAFPAAAFALSAFIGPGCILDFDDVSDLPCPCDPEHTCLRTNPADPNEGRCVRRSSVELFKSCDINTPNNGNDLCPTNSVCQAINGEGPRCLPQCTPSNYATPEAGGTIGTMCPPGNTCWESPQGGVCSAGVCNDLPNNCPPGQECVKFNGAGVCFTTCGIFDENPLPCGGGEICHPIGETRVTACVPQGDRLRTQDCNATSLCEKTDEFGRPLVCEKPQMATSQRRRCYPICVPGIGARCDPATLGENCFTARANVDPQSMRDLGVCASNI